METTEEIQNQMESYSTETSITKKFAIPFFDFEKSKQEAIQQYNRYKKANPTLNESELQYKISVDLINNYAKKTGHIGAYLCLFSIIPFIESVFSFGCIPAELAILTRYNMHLMVKLAVINNYPFSDDDFVDTLIVSARTHHLGCTIAKCFLRLLGTIPIAGQLITLTFGCAICNYMNKKETIKFGKNILKEYNLDYEVYSNDNWAGTIKKIFPYLLLIVLVARVCVFFWAHSDNNEPIDNGLQQETQVDNAQKDPIIAYLKIQNVNTQAQEMYEYFKTHTQEENDLKFAEFYKNNFHNITYPFDNPKELKSFLKSINIEFNDNNNSLSITSVPLFTYSYNKEIDSSFIPNYSYLSDLCKNYVSEDVIKFLDLMQDFCHDAENLGDYLDNENASKTLVEKWVNKWKVFIYENPDFCLKNEINEQIQSGLEILNS